MSGAQPDIWTEFERQERAILEEELRAPHPHTLADVLWHERHPQTGPSILELPCALCGNVMREGVVVVAGGEMLVCPSCREQNTWCGGCGRPIEAGQPTRSDGRSAYHEACAERWVRDTCTGCGHFITSHFPRYLSPAGQSLCATCYRNPLSQEISA